MDPVLDTSYYLHRIKLRCVKLIYIYASKKEHFHIIFDKRYPYDCETYYEPDNFFFNASSLLRSSWISCCCSCTVFTSGTTKLPYRNIFFDTDIADIRPVGETADGGGSGIAK